LRFISSHLRRKNSEPPAATCGHFDLEPFTKPSMF
jgi:hypothetical protein